MYIWHHKRQVQKTPAIESLQLNRQRIRRDREAIELFKSALEIGIELDPADLALETLQRDEPSREQLLEALQALMFGGVDHAYTTALVLEGVNLDPSSIPESVEVARREFHRVFGRTLKDYPFVMKPVPEARRQSLHTYFHWIENPTDANRDAWITSIQRLTKAIADGEIRVTE